MTSLKTMMAALLAGSLVATAGGFAWAIGNQISWACAACVDY